MEGSEGVRGKGTLPIYLKYLRSVRSALTLHVVFWPCLLAHIFQEGAEEAILHMPFVGKAPCICALIYELFQYGDYAHEPPQLTSGCSGYRLGGKEAVVNCVAAHVASTPGRRLADKIQ